MASERELTATKQQKQQQQPEQPDMLPKSFLTLGSQNPTYSKPNLTFPSHFLYSPTHARVKSTTYVHWKGQQQVFTHILHGKKKTVSHLW